MPGPAQETLILDEAVGFFADHGFDGPTRLLAGRLGISHSALYRRFRSKEALAARVRQAQFEDSWQPVWTEVLRDCALPFPARLLAFLRQVAPLLCGRDWLRLAMRAGLSAPVPGPSPAAMLEARIVLPVCEAWRGARGLAPAVTLPGSAEAERAWALLGRVLYAAMRRHVWCTDPPPDLDLALRIAVATFCAEGPACAAMPPGEEARPASPPRGIAPKQAGQRLPPAERERRILDGAIAHFSRFGLDAQLRDLARDLDITHPLLYRYFRGKEELVERVYGEFQAQSLVPEWEALKADPSLPLAERLLRFYRAYLAAIDHPHWLRIFAFAGLRGEGASRRYMADIGRRVIAPVAAELRREAASRNLSCGEAEAAEWAWSLHGAVCFLAIRKRILGAPVPEPPDRALGCLVAQTLVASRAAIGRAGGSSAM